MVFFRLHELPTSISVRIAADFGFSPTNRATWWRIITGHGEGVSGCLDKQLLFITELNELSSS